MWSNSLWPSFAGLHREEREHGGHDVVVVEALLPPLPGRGRRQLVLGVKLEVLTLAVLGRVLALVRAEEELAIEQLHGDHSKDEVEQNVDDQDVDDVLQRVDHAVEHGLELWHSLDRLQRTQHTQHPQRLDCAQILAGRAATVSTQT